MPLQKRPTKRQSVAGDDVCNHFNRRHALDICIADLVTTMQLVRHQPADVTRHQHGHAVLACHVFFRTIPRLRTHVPLTARLKIAHDGGKRQPRPVLISTRDQMPLPRDTCGPERCCCHQRDERRHAQSDRQLDESAAPPSHALKGHASTSRPRHVMRTTHPVDVSQDTFPSAAGPMLSFSVWRNRRMSSAASAAASQDRTQPGASDDTV